jgi:hypothetical protein
MTGERDRRGYDNLNTHFSGQKSNYRHNAYQAQDAGFSGEYILHSFEGTAEKRVELLARGS